MKFKKKTLFWIILHLAIFTSLVVLVTSFRNTKQTTIKNSFVNLYQKPELDSKITGQVSEYQKVTIEEEIHNWLYIKDKHNQHGWIQKSMLEAKPIEKVYNIEIKTKVKTNLLSNYDKNSSKLKTIAKNQTLYLLNKRGSFVFVKANNLYGWVDQSVLKSTDKTKLNLIDKSIKNTPSTLYAKNQYVTLYDKPSTKAKSIYTFQAFEKMKKLKYTKDWYQVKTKDGQTGYLPNWNVITKKIVTTKKTQKIANNLQNKTIVIDPGHGGEDPGSLTADNRYEAQATLETSKVLQRMLEEQGANVIMTRDSDQTVSLAKRAKISNDEKADAFICIHYDSTEEHNVASGTTTYYYHENAEKLAQDINTQLAQTLPVPNKGYQVEDHQVTRDNKQPAVLLELGYLSNDTDANYAFSDEYHQLVATAITKGLDNFFAK